MKLTLVVQRYGRDIVGGAETLCRGVAEGLAGDHDVEVVTTCARSYVTWANEYPEGTQEIAGVRVRRFAAERERDIEAFNALSEQLFSGPRSPEQEREWLDAQGPYVPRLVDHIHEIAPDRDRLLFFTYLYYPTVRAIDAAPERSVLAPTAHDEAPFWMDLYEPVFRRPAGLVFLTRAEGQLVRRRFPDLQAKTAVIGSGIDDLEALQAAASAADPDEPPALLYAGRIDEGKGVGTLIEYLERYRVEAGRDLRLWLMGEPAMPIPEHDWIDPLGFVDDDEKVARMARATVLLAPSALESFAIVALEAMAAGTPVLANAAGEATVEHCRAADGGLYYRDYPEFREALTLLLDDPRLRRRLAESGARYVRDHYAWPTIVQRYEDFLRGL